MAVLDAFPRYYELVEKKSGLWVYRHRRYGADSARRVTGRKRPASARNALGERSGLGLHRGRGRSDHSG
jgi:hypothetical protein